MRAEKCIVQFVYRSFIAVIHVYVIHTTYLQVVFCNSRYFFSYRRNVFLKTISLPLQDI